MYTLDKDNERYISDSKSYEFGEIYLTEGGIYNNYQSAGY